MFSRTVKQIKDVILTGVLTPKWLAIERESRIRLHSIRWWWRCHPSFGSSWKYNNNNNDDDDDDNNNNNNNNNNEW